MQLLAPGITILGLGPGDSALLTRRAWTVLSNIDEIYLRTRQHPTVAGFPEGLTVHSFDDLYEQEPDFATVYARIIDEVLALGARPEGVVYAVPGHPFVAETTSPEIVRRAREAGLAVQVIEGLSFVEPTLTALGVDPLPQTSVVDALELVVAHTPSFPPDVPALVAQVYSKEIAAEVKITLMAVYPDEHPVQLVHAAGTADALVEELPLYEIDRSAHIGLLTSLYVPSLGAYTSFEGFQELVAHLRAPEGCPWDREQTHQTLRRNLIEEAYEALAALDSEDPDLMREEFGDLLLQIVLHAQIATEYGEYTMAEVIQGIHTKLVSRHPHVFGDVDLGDAEAVIVNWERIKAKERSDKGDNDKGLLDSIPVALPALTQAETFQKRAARIGFDWDDIQGVIDKICEEVEEVRSASTDEERAAEIGDLLFAIVNLARWLDADPEAVLRATNLKFRERFRYIEQHAKAAGRELSEMSLAEMDALWDEAKKSEL